MMHHKTAQLSVLLTTHIPLEWLEQILAGLLPVSKPEMEIIIIDDNSSEDVRAVIKEHIRTSPNERVFLFEHDRTLGRGNALNEALAQASGEFIWAPVKVRSFNQQLLKDTLRKLYTTPTAFWVMDYELPDNAESWLKASSEDLLPDDSCFIWNRNSIQSEDFFFNPFMTHLHCAELALRLQEANAWQKTDPFFVIDNSFFIPAVGRNLEEFFHTAYRVEKDPETRRTIQEKLVTLPPTDEKKQAEEGLLPQSHQLLAQGDAKRALQLTDKFLSSNPDHHEAIRLKISALEKMRRHVEAAELKHHLKGIDPEEPHQAELFLDDVDPEPESGKKAGEIIYSVVVPTTGSGKGQLEAFLTELEPNINPDQTELIVIDNASIDDTFEYLEQLAVDNFLNLNVITNNTNRGFGASVNQGIEAASGSYVLVCHSDVNIRENTAENLSAVLSQTPDAVLAAPTLNQTRSAAQQKKNQPDESFLQTDRVDSCCFMVPKDSPFRFDEDYGVAFFEMDDFCRQIQEKEKLILVSTETAADHHAGKITGMMGLNMVPQLKWKNRSLFQQKWEELQKYEIPKQGSYGDRFESLGAPADPSNPPAEWVQAVHDFITDEVKTDILRSDFDANELITIVSTLLIANERELLRTLEDRLDDLQLPQPLLVLFVHFYFEKNIYSRCKHYLSMAGDSHPIFDLYRLKIAVADKDLEEASELLNGLMKRHPCSPDLFFLAGQLYNYTGESDEAKSFYAMANQLDPKRFPSEETAFEINY